MSSRSIAILGALLLSAAAQAQGDAPGCGDHPLFPRLQGFHIAHCESSQATSQRFPVGPVLGDSKRTAVEEVTGVRQRLHYRYGDGMARPSPAQNRRAFREAAQRAGAVVVGEYPEACQAELDEPAPAVDRCIRDGVTVRFDRSERQVWGFMEADDDAAGYQLRIVERGGMPPAPVANEMLERIIKDGYVTLQVNFDYAKATIRQESLPQLVQVVDMLKLAPEMNIQVAGHTDSIGSAAFNRQLSEARAESVVKTLVASGVPASRLSAIGYGEDKPVADNDSPAGRATNRRVELIKR
ncbi:MAG TPA: OmpA family protein [Solimonas sp.]|nr:OmpA family protein [Solimonas sp.]